jgi:large subunit ribosomal protein L9
MDVILLERIEKLGQMGDVVRVKTGYARNYLLPQNKALRATKPNLERFQQDRVQLEARNLELRNEAEAVGEKVDGSKYTIIRQAGDSGQLYGSVSTRDVAELVTEGGTSVTRNQIILERPIKSVGLHDLLVSLHPEVRVTVTVNVARSEDEAERQARGEVVGRDDDDYDDEDDAIAVEEVFEDDTLAEQAVEELSDATDDDADGSEAEAAGSGEDDAEVADGEGSDDDKS